MENPAHAGVAVFCEIAINGVLAYFFYTYAWKNPDLARHPDCWAVDNDDNGFPGKLTDDYKNVSIQF